MTAHFKNFLGGEWADGTGASENRNPSNTDDVVGVYTQGSAADVDTAVAAALAAFPAWSRTTPQQRYDVLKVASDEVLARKEELGRLLSREEGKTLPEGIGEVTRAGQILAFFAGEALRIGGETVPSVRPGVGVEMTREPIGVVGLITPWNFPIAIPAWKIAPALAYGNCVVIKPAELVPGSVWALADILTAPGCPRACSTSSWAAARWSARRCWTHPGVDAISFTGSVSTGRRVARPASRRSDEEGAARDGRQEPAGRARRRRPRGRGRGARCNGAYFSTGQRCTASSRLIVTEGIHDRFVARADRAAEGAASWDDALKAGTQIGPVVDDEPARPGPSTTSRIGRDEGAELPWGGERLNRETEGYYLQPGAVHRGEQRPCASPARRSSGRWPRDPRQGLRRGAGARATTRRSASRRASAPPR
jgi:acyl-CoA reductase-like NAD-dependent aldehyde dehydrogenase